ncbi:MAG: ATP-binding protein [bacterium]
MTIPSNLDNIEAVEKLAERAAEYMKFREAERDNLAIAVTEAVNNAILHGNKKNPDKKVWIKFTFEKSRLLVSIRDEGKGFNPDKLSDPLAPENLLKESGRGIFILSTLMDDVKFSFAKGGTEIKMVKERK